MPKANYILFSLVFLMSFNSIAKEGMPQFNVESFPSQLFWLLITFSFLYLFMAFMVLPRIRENIRLRKNKISNDIEIATTTRDQTQKMIIEYNKRIEEAKLKSKNILKNSTKKAEDDFNNQIEIAKKQMENKLYIAEKEIKLKKQEIEKKITTSSEEISKIIVSKVLKV